MWLIARDALVRVIWESITVANSSKSEKIKQEGKGKRFSAAIRERRVSLYEDTRSSCGCCARTDIDRSGHATGCLSGHTTRQLVLQGSSLLEGPSTVTRGVENLQ